MNPTKSAYDERDEPHSVKISPDLPVWKLLKGVVEYSELYEKSSPNVLQASGFVSTYRFRERRSFVRNQSVEAQRTSFFHFSSSGAKQDRNGLKKIFQTLKCFCKRSWPDLAFTMIDMFRNGLIPIESQYDCLLEDIRQQEYRVCK